MIPDTGEGVREHSLKCVSRAIASRASRSSFNAQPGAPGVICVVGAGALGKSSLAQAVQQELAESVILTVDGFLLERSVRSAFSVGGDDDAALNLKGFYDVLANLISNVVTEVPDYDHTLGVRTYRRLRPSLVRWIIIDGGRRSLKLDVGGPSLTVLLWAATDVHYSLRRHVDTCERGYSEEQFAQLWP